ncbi:MAG: ABC transporter ATP-binding protein [Acidimicrobiales bacterium]
MGWFTGGVSEEDKLDLTASREVLARAFRLLGPYRAKAIRSFVLLVLWTGTVLAGPYLVGRSIDSGIRAGDRAALNTSVAGYLAAAIAGYFLYRGAVITLARVGENFLRDMRRSVFDRLLDQSMSFYDREKAGVLVSRMTSDIDSLSELIQFGLLMFTAALLQLVGTTVFLMFMSWKLMLVCLVAIPIVGIASRKFQRDSNRAFLDVRNRIGTTLSALQEGISGVRIVQAFAREDLEAERFSETNQELFESHMASVKVAAWYLPIVEAAGTITTAVAIGYGGWLVRDGQLSIGVVVAFILLLQGLFEPVQQLSQLFNLVQSATASLDKLFGLLDEPIEVDAPLDPVAFPDRGEISVRGVGFAYSGGPAVLSGVDITIGAGERVAFVGPTGAGKSTLAKLVARFYDPTEGAITFGGVDLRAGSPSDLRQRVVVVPQEGYLFAGTIGDNIRIACPTATDAEVRAALEKIGVLDRIDAFENGLDTEVREGGSRLSGGERQLVSLARAALADPAVLVLDEATSSLDPGTEQIVERALESLMTGRTVIAIAHRLSTSQRCDRVAVIDGGGIIELGTHDELVAAGGPYAALFASWERGLAGTDATP